MEILDQEKAFYAGKKIRKNDFAPSEKFSCYAPACDHGQCDFISYLQFSIICHCSGEFLLLLGKDLAFLEFIN